MSKEQYYIVFYSEGSHGDYSVIELFVTKDYEYGKKYIDKFNAMLNKWTEYYAQFKDNIWDDDFSEHILNRINQLYETNEASISKIDYR
jgi:hypothetical protein